MLLLRTLFSHYRRHPVQGLFLLTGVTIANVLLVGTLLINAQARASYAEGEQVLRAQPVGSIRSVKANRSIDEVDYIGLRRQGFDRLAPVLRRFLRLESGELIEVLGVDLLAMPRPTGIDDQGTSEAGSSTADDSTAPGFGDFTLPPYSLWASPARLKQLGAVAGERMQLDTGRALPPAISVSGEELGHRVLLDIGVLQDLTDSRGQLSEILVFAPARDNPPAAGETGRLPTLAALQAALPENLRWVDAESDLDPAQLTRSFHLNLAAMGLLAFVVGVFLIYNALAFSYTDRRDLIRKLRLAGVTRRELGAALAVELAAFVLTGTAIGYLLGSWLATALLPGVGLTLAQLYGVYIAYPDSLFSYGLVFPLIMTAIATVICVLFPLQQAINQPVLERQSPAWQQSTLVRRDIWLLVTGLVMLLLALVLAMTATALWLALASMAFLLLGAALCLPACLRGLLTIIAWLVPRGWARTSWLLADSRWLLGPASLALMAMTLALVSNSGLNTMIGSFRDATDQWLQQRLVAQVYLAREAQLPGLEPWLQENYPGVEPVERFATRQSVVGPDGDRRPVEVVSLPVSDRFLESVHLMDDTPDAMSLFARSAGIVVSERAMRLDGWRPGAMVKLCEAAGAVPVLGVYHDYGNPQSQWMVSIALFRQCWPDVSAAGLGLIGPQTTDWVEFRQALATRFGLDDTQVIDQQALKAQGLAVFDRTFAVTNALNILTLLVAGIGIFCAVSAIHHHRLAQQALLTALGLSRRERGAMLLLQWGLLGAFCVVLVWPFGAALAWLLASVVTPVAFGWSFSLQTEWQHLPMLIVLAAGSLLLAVLLPSLQLLRASPGSLLREQPV